MYQALAGRDTAYEGVFIVAVRTTGVFCRPTCPARKPKPENVEFFATTRDALAAGFRPCKRCRPLERGGGPPAWLTALLADVDRDPVRRWTDADLRARAVDPTRVRRWFQQQHGMTFHAYQRARRLGAALGRLRNGDDLTRAAYDSGYESLSGFRDAFGRLFGGPPGGGRGTTPAVVTRILTPLGPMVAAATDDGVCLLEFADRRMLETQLRRVQQRLRCAIAPGEHPHLDRLEREIEEYFAGRRTAFTVALELAGTTFQETVWAELLRIPFGRTSSYEAIARAIRRPNAHRAVGRANGDNRIAIVVPCHRVLRADRTLCGYGGGLWRKRRLLDLERGVDS
jgi:AraC family transcriptional regulator of adaptative response/methylated-DNA-[protein]-cysteine methyltransferase